MKYLDLFNAFFCDEEMSERVYNWIKELENENANLKAALDVAKEALKTGWPGMYGRTVQEFNNEYLGKIERILK